ncbi:hypothetical protein GCM10028814_08380 [Angustibacter aerolatus]
MRRHDADVTSLVFGLVFLGVGVLVILQQQDVLSFPAASVAAPAVLVAAGLVGLVATLGGNRRRQAPALDSAPGSSAAATTTTVTPDRAQPAQPAQSPSSAPSTGATRLASSESSDDTVRLTKGPDTRPLGRQDTAGE